MMATVNITDTNIESTIQDNEIVILDFWASWCGPCRAFGPTFEAASEKHQDISFGKVNTEEQRGLSGQLGIRSIPTLMVFRDQILVFNQAGAMPAGPFNDLIQKVRDLDMVAVKEEIAKHESEHASH
jgi:thioredoxin